MTDIKQVVAEINKLMGVGTITLASEVVVESISTGVLPIDHLLDGGLPRGRFTEFFGDYSTLKSYVGLKAIASVQKMGGSAALVDTEGAFDPEWAVKLGADPSTLAYVDPETIEQAADATEGLIRAGVDLIIWDSVAASLPQVERDKREAEEKHQPARLAAAMSRVTRKLNAANKRTALVWINQTRLAVGIVYGSPERTPGGKSLPFYASHRVAMRKAGRVTRDQKSHDGYTGKTVKETYGIKIRATLEKSKLTAPHRDVLFTFDLETGEVDEARYLVSQSIAAGLIEKKGKMYWLPENEDQKVAGIEKMVEMVRTTPSLASTLRSNFLGSRSPARLRDETQSPSD